MRKTTVAVVTSMIISSLMISTSYAGQWHSDSNGWWYEEQDQISKEELNGGYYPAGQWWSDGKAYYYFDDNGYMISDTITPDGYKVGADGTLITHGTEQLPNINAWNHFYELEAEADLIDQKISQALSQYDMTMGSLELYNFWDSELNVLYGKLESTLSVEDFEKLRGSQREWIAHKEAVVSAEGDKWIGGTIRPMMMNMTGAHETWMRIIWLLQNYTVN